MRQSKLASSMVNFWAHRKIVLTHFIGLLSGYDIKSVAHGQGDARPTVIFLVLQHHRPFVFNKKNYTA